MKRFDPAIHHPATEADWKKIENALWEGWELMVEEGTGEVWIGSREDKIAKVSVGIGADTRHETTKEKVLEGIKGARRLKEVVRAYNSSVPVQIKKSGVKLVLERAVDIGTINP